MFSEAIIVSPSSQENLTRDFLLICDLFDEFGLLFPRFIRKTQVNQFDGYLVKPSPSLSVVADFHRFNRDSAFTHLVNDTPRHCVNNGTVDVRDYNALTILMSVDLEHARQPEVEASKCGAKTTSGDSTSPKQTLS